MANENQFVDQGDLLSPGENNTDDVGAINTASSTLSEDPPVFNIELPPLSDISKGPSRAKWADPTGFTLNNIDRESYTDYLGHQPFSFITGDPDDLRARAQTTGQKSLYMLPKLVTRVGTNVLGSTVGLLYGGGAFLSEIGNGGNAMGKAFFDNSFQRSLDGINEWMDGKLPHYYTKEEHEYGFFKSAFGPGAANFWLNDFTQGLSFVIGAVLSEGLASGMTRSAAAFKTKHLFSKHGRTKMNAPMTSIKETGKDLDKLVGANSRAGFATTLRQLGTGAMYEAGVEGRHHFDRTVEVLLEQWREENNCQLCDPPKDEMSKIIDYATKSANAVFAGNTALVGYGNYLLFPKIFGRGFNSTRNSFLRNVREDVTDQGLKYVNLLKEIGKKEALARNIWRVGKVPLYEGFVEEGGQKLLDFSGQHAAEQFYTLKGDPTFRDMVIELVNSTNDAFGEAYGSAEGQKEIGIGFLLAAIGLPGRVETKGKDGETTSGWGWHGGVYGSLQDIATNNKLTDDFVKVMNTLQAERESTGGPGNIVTNFNLLVRAGALQDIENIGDIIDSAFMRKNGEWDSASLYMIHKIVTGNEASLYQDAEEIRNMTIERFRETFNHNMIEDANDEALNEKKNELADKYEARAKRVKEVWSKVNGTFSQFGMDQKMTMAHILSIPTEYDQREDSMIESNRKAGLKDETEVKVKAEDVRRERDKQENDSLYKRLKNLWSRLTANVKKNILALPEAKEIMQKRNIKSFTDPTHLEELMILKAQKIKVLREQIDALQADKSLDDQPTFKEVIVDGKKVKIEVPSPKTNQLNQLTEEMNLLLDRLQYLSKAINEGLDPDISTSEQSLLDEWKQRDPAGYAENSPSVIQRLKDIRKLRAARHRMIDLYNQLVQAHDAGARENVTWSSKGTLIPRPEMMFQNVVSDIEDIGINIKDTILRNLYNRYAGKTIRFSYTHTGNIKISELRKFARENGVLNAVDRRAAEILKEEKDTELEAYLKALEHHGFPLDQIQRTETYTTFVESRKVKDGNDQVLIRLPNPETIKLLRKQEVLKDLAQKGNEEAAEQLLQVEAELTTLATEYKANKLDLLLHATNIEIVDNNIVIEDLLKDVTDISGEEVQSELNHAKSTLKSKADRIKELKLLIEEFRKQLANPESFAKKGEKRDEYFTVNGVNYSRVGLANKIAELTQPKMVINQKTQESEIVPSEMEQLKRDIAVLEIRIGVYKDQLEHFFSLKTELKDGINPDKYQNLIFDYVKRNWVGDQNLILQLRKSNAFNSNPVMQSIWENLLPEGITKDEASTRINDLVAMLQNEKELPQEVIDLIDKEVADIKDKYAVIASAAEKMKQFIRVKQNGEVDMRGPKETVQAYLALQDELKTLDRMLGYLRPENVTGELRKAVLRSNELFEARAVEYQRLQGLQNILMGNLQAMLDIYMELRYGAEELINHEENPESKIGETVGEEFQEVIQSDESNVYYYGMPITVHGFAKSAGHHKLAIQKVEELSKYKAENPATWAKKPQLEKELQFYKDVKRFFKFTEELSSKNQPNYNIMFVNRQTIPDELSDKVLFYDEKTKKYKYAKDFKGETLRKEELEDIKIIIVNSKNEPIVQKDNDGIERAVYSSIPSSNVYNTIKRKGETIDLYRYAKEDLVPNTVKEVSHEGRVWYVGELTESAQDEIAKHKVFRSQLLNLGSPRYTKISGTSNGLPIWVNGDPNHRAKASETIVLSETDVKDIRLNISTNSKLNKVNFEGRVYAFKAGTPYVVKNGRLIPVHIDTLSNVHQENIYNLLRLYAQNLLTGNDPDSKVSPAEANMLHKVNENGDVEVLYADKTITQILESMVYYGKHSSKRARTEFSIYMKGGILYFGSQQIDINQLANPNSENSSIHQDLKDFLATLNYQINNLQLKDDVTARQNQNINDNKERTKWKKARAKYLANKGYDISKLSTLSKAEQAEVFKLMNRFKKKNPYPQSSKVTYTGYVEVKVNNNLEVSLVTWPNYTDYLLSSKGRTLNEIPIKFNLHKDRSGQGVDTSEVPQFLNVYLTWGSKTTINDLLNADSMVDTNLKKKTDNSVEEEVAEEEAIDTEYEEILESPSGLSIGQTIQLTQPADRSRGQEAFQIIFNVTDINAEQENIGIEVIESVWLDKDKTVLELDEAFIEQLQQQAYNPDAFGANFTITVIQEEDPGAETGGSQSLDTLTNTTDETIVDNFEFEYDENEGNLSSENSTDSETNTEEEDGKALASTMPHSELELMDLYEELEQFKAMVPKTENGTPIFPVKMVQGLVHGKNYAYFTKAGEILLSTEAIKGAIYHETFHGITDKLLSLDEKIELYNEVRGIRGKAKTYKGELKNLKDFTDKEADEWLAEEFRSYVLLKGNYKVGSKVKKSLIQRLFDFLFSFFTNVSETESLFKRIHTGYYADVINNYTTYDLTTGKAMRKGQVDAVALKDINQGITVALFDLATARGIDFSDFFSYGLDSSAKLYGIYGRPGIKGDTVYKAIRGSLETLVRQLNGNITTLEAKTKKTQDDIIRLRKYKQERVNVIKAAEAVRLDWNSFVNYNLQFLNKYDFSLQLEHLTGELSELNENENGIEVAKDTMHFRSANEINPFTTFSPSVKLLLATLPESTWIMTPQGRKLSFVKTNYGLVKLANYGQIANTLFKTLANQYKLSDVLFEIEELSKKDAVYKVLLDRLGLYKVKDKSAYSTVKNGSLNEAEMNLLLSFISAFKKSSQEHIFITVDTESRRKLTHADQEGIVQITKGQWKSNFKSVLNKKLGIRNKSGTLVLNLNKKIQIKSGQQVLSKTLGGVDGWFSYKGRGLAENLVLLENLGIKFTNKRNLLKMLKEDSALLDQFNTEADWIFGNISTEVDPKTKKVTYLKTADLSDLFNDTDLYGRLSTLVDFEAKSTHKSITLQNTFAGKKRHGITPKNHLNLLMDKLNNDPTAVQELLQNGSNMFGSRWLQAIANGTQINIGTLLGLKNNQENESFEISKGSKANIALNHLTSILSGHNPVIRTGNKKSENTIYLGKPTFNINRAEMVDYLFDIVLSEVITANKIKNGDANQIDRLKVHGNKLQWFNHPFFKETQKVADLLINGPRFKDAKLNEWIDKNNKIIKEEINNFLNLKVQELFQTFIDFGILMSDGKTVTNVGIDHDLLVDIRKALPKMQRDAVVLDKNTIYKSEFLDKGQKLPFFINYALDQFNNLQLINIIEQSKLVLGHPALYKELFKRTSMFVSPKTFVEADENILDWHSNNMPNGASKSLTWSSELSKLTRKEPVVEASIYMNQYKRILTTMGAPMSAIERLDEAFTDMSVFDGGGLIHLDAYRRVRKLTNTWNRDEEFVYQKIINNEPLTGAELGLMNPIKPQVVGGRFVDKIYVKHGDKFALFPIHPNLSKLISHKAQNISSVMDLIFEEMTAMEIDYQTFPSSSKIGAQMNSKGQFNPLINHLFQFTPLNGDRSGIVKFPLEDFGIQIAPKRKLVTSVSQGTQLNTLLPADIYDNGVISRLYEESDFTDNMSWENAINRYHEIHSTLIQREVSNITAKLGAIETSTGFESLNNKRTRHLLRTTLTSELRKRDVPRHIIESVNELFTLDVKGSPTMYFNQLYQKNKLETLIYAVITNQVIKRKMFGNKSMIQSAVGYNFAQKEGLPGLPTDKLKFYRKEIERKPGETNEEFAMREALSPTLSMQVYLPYAAREILGIPDGQEVEISPEVLQIVGFRIPTEFLSSMESIQVAGFLPKAAGNVMIVPDEMVAKSGADFDSDELTLYFNHTQIIPTENGAKLVKQTRFDYESPMDHLRALRLNESSLQTYKAVALELYKLANREKEGLDFLRELEYARNVKNDEAMLQKLDKKLADLGFNKLPDSMKQPANVLVNELIDLSNQILLHPLTFEKLIDPVGAYDIKWQAEEIQQERIEAGLAEDVSPYLFDMLSFKGMVNTSHQMWSTLGGTGVFATSATNQIKAQRAGLRLNLENKVTYNIFDQQQAVRFMFEGLHETTVLPLGALYDINEQEKISSSIRQYITSSVDGEKNPFAMYINAGVNTAGIHMLLNRVKVPRSVVIDFMSQPIIVEYLEQQSKYQSAHAKSVKKAIPSAFRQNSAIVGNLKIKYGRSMGTPIPLRAEQLREMRALPADKMTPVQKQLQLQILNDFLRYRMLAEQVRKMQTVTSPDTTKLKNAHELTYIKALKTLLQKDGYFINLEGILGSDAKSPGLPITSTSAVLTQEPMLTKLNKIFDQSGALLEHLDFKMVKDASGRRQIADGFLSIALSLLSENKSKQEIIKHLELFDNHLTSYLIQTSTLNTYYPSLLYKKYGAVKINSLLEELFQGVRNDKGGLSKLSLPRRIEQAKRKYPENMFLEELLPILQEYTDPKDFNYYIDKLQLTSKNHDHYELDHLGRDVEVLSEKEPQLVFDLYLYSLLKSGTAFSPTAFFQALPESILLPITRRVFEQAEVDLVSGNLDLNTIYEDFLDNSWDNPSVVDTVYYTAKFQDTKIKRFKSYQGKRVIYKVKKATKKVGIHDRVVYYTHFYKFKGTEETKTGTKHIYELTMPKGVRGEFITAGREPLLNSHVTPKPVGKLTLTKTELDKLYLDQSLIIKRKYELKEQNYRLNDGKIVSLTEIERKSTKKGIQAFKTYVLKFPTQISEEVEAQDIAQEAAPEVETTNLLDLNAQVDTKNSMKNDQESCKKNK